MDAIQLLRQMHADQKVRFKEILGSTDSARARQLWTDLLPLLTVHEQIEDRFLYEPLAQEQGPGTTLGDWASEHDRQVGEAERLIQQVNGLSPDDPEWRLHIGRIAAVLAKHIFEEELEVFPRVDQLWSPARREHVGEQMQVALAAAVPDASDNRRTGSAPAAMRPKLPRPARKR